MPPSQVHQNLPGKHERGRPQQRNIHNLPLKLVVFTTNIKLYLNGVKIYANINLFLLKSLKNKQLSFLYNNFNGNKTHRHINLPLKYAELEYKFVTL